jgi:hypothetical protein
MRTIKVALWGVFFLAVGASILLLARPAHSHEGYRWVEKYDNGHGTNCCGEHDIVFISREDASAADVGSVLTAVFPDVGEVTVRVLIVHPTEDRQGRPMLSKWGCLFKPTGS